MKNQQFEGECVLNMYHAVIALKTECSRKTSTFPTHQRACEQVERIHGFAKDANQRARVR